MAHYVNGIDMDDPFFKYTLEEKRKMSQEELFALYEESGRYFDSQYGKLNESTKPKFNTIEELREYYHCRPLEDFINDVYGLLNIKR